MASIGEKMGWIAESYKARQEFYADWYSKHTFAETVTGVVKDHAGEVKQVLEPSAVGAISENIEALDRFVNPVVLSPHTMTAAGYVGGLGSLVANMAIGLPDFAAMLVSGKIGIKEMVTSSWDMLKHGALHAGGLVKGELPVKDPYEMGFEIAEKVGGGIMVIYGGVQMCKGAINVGRAAKESAKAAAKAAAALMAEEASKRRNFNTPLLAYNVGGVAGGAVSASAANALAPSNVWELVHGPIFMSNIRNKGRLEMVKRKFGDPADPRFDHIRASKKYMEFRDFYSKLSEEKLLKQNPWTDTRGNRPSVLAYCDELDARGYGSEANAIRHVEFGEVLPDVFYDE